jgi:pantoate kinase
LREAKAFSPAHITGFFQICDRIENPLSKGSRGAGVSIRLGTTTKVRVEKSAKTHVHITINGNAASSALVSERVINSFLSLVEGNYKVLVDHDVEVPIGCGFGSSGAGALSLALALNHVFGLNLSRLEAAQLAHRAEVECNTGLGTVIAETFGGLEIRVKPGAPGIGEIESVPLNGDYIVISLSFGSIPTRGILTSEVSRRRINEVGGDFVNRLVRCPTVPNFMKLSRKFAEHVGLISKRLRTVLEETDSAGFMCSMAMLGETVFSIVKRKEIREIHKIFSKHATFQGDLIVAEIDTEGARLL